MWDHLKFIIILFYLYLTIGKEKFIQACLEAHRKEMRAIASQKEQNIAPFLESFKPHAIEGLNINSIRYILNLQNLKYEFISNSCTAFTGMKPVDFYGKGMDILSEIMIIKDFRALSTDLFPAMNAIVQELCLEEKRAVVFELHYHMQNNRTGKITPVVEYSSFANFDDKGSPSISTGICYQSVLDFNGVRGLVRLNRGEEQETIFDHTIYYSIYVLTPSEKKIIAYLLEGKDYKWIASTEFISPHTVKTHIKNIYKKLEVNKASELLAHFTNNRCL
jgi:DNA-binding CsgD family transcriptional regulator